jgi:putative membrane protein
MDRRSLIQATLATVLVPSMARGQTTSANGMTPETKHAADTLEAGMVSLEGSKAALTKVTDPALKRFAEFEVAEQETVGKVVKAASKMSETTEPKLSDDAKAMIEKIKAMPAGKEFEEAYFKGQVEGHTKLLEIQTTYLGAGKDVTHRAIAMLAAGHIKEHLANLQAMRKG